MGGCGRVRSAGPLLGRGTRRAAPGWWLEWCAPEAPLAAPACVAGALAACAPLLGGPWRSPPPPLLPPVTQAVRARRDAGRPYRLSPVRHPARALPFGTGHHRHPGARACACRCQSCIGAPNRGCRRAARDLASPSAACLRRSVGLGCCRFPPHRLPAPTSLFTGPPLVGLCVRLVGRPPALCFFCCCLVFSPPRRRPP